MSASLKMVIGVIIFYVTLFTFFGFLGQEQLAEIELTESLSDLDINSSSDLRARDMPSFFQGLTFTISNLPVWLSFILGLVPSLILLLGVVWAIRGI